MPTSSPAAHQRRLARRGRMEAPSMPAPAGSEMSGALRARIAIHNVGEFDQRLIRDWVGQATQAQQLSLGGAVATCMLPVIPRFIAEGDLELHGQIGEKQAPPRFTTIKLAGTNFDVPAEVQFFLEDRVTNERFVLQVEDYHDGDYRISVHGRSTTSKLDELREYANCHNPLRGQTFDLRGKVLNLDAAETRQVILTPEQSTAIDRHILGFATRFDQLKTRRARLSRGVLLEGVPGCGKSLLLRTLPHRLPGFSACLATPEQIARHGSLETLQQLIEMTAPCAVFLEEIDLFGSDRNLGGGPSMAELMQMMDGLRHIPGVLWIATTNRPETVEAALADRPGRFDRRIAFGPLDMETRTRLITELIKPQEIESEALQQFVQNSDGWTGAQVRELCETLRLLSDGEVFTSAELDEALADCDFYGLGTFGFRQG